jgi:hypothetical protein
MLLRPSRALMIAIPVTVAPSTRAAAIHRPT